MKVTLSKKFLIRSLCLLGWRNRVSNHLQMSLKLHLTSFLVLCQTTAQVMPLDSNLSTTQPLSKHINTPSSGTLQMTAQKYGLRLAKET